MADVSSNTGEDHVKHGKPRKRSDRPRMDMTPMVDLAFLLLTFFVLTSCLNKPKTMEMAVPKTDGDPMPVPTELANTILLDGNKEGKLYVYHGKAENAELMEFTLDAKSGLRQFLLDQNKKITEKMQFVRSVYKSGTLDKASYEKLKSMLAENLSDNTDDAVVAKRKQKDYEKAMIRLDNDLLKKEMSDTTFRLVSADIRNDDAAPFFIIKWGNEAKYNDVINVIDELKIADISKYALTRISNPEYIKLSEKTGVKYPELSEVNRINN